ncbi:MAG: methionine--tRNA ligase beta chain [Candidatus Omnitrophota bacterium]|jgi:methionine--tRNA ligase beta chain
MISIEEFQRMNLRVAKIISAEDHPNADRLLVLKIELDKEERQIVAGIKSHYAKEDLIGKEIVIVSNLEPVEIRGVLSNGMLLAAKDSENFALISTDKFIQPGSKVG